MVWKEGVRVTSIYGSPERQKKSYLKSYLAAIKRLINRSTKVIENQYLTASGIKSFQKQTAGNNCPVFMTDSLNVRLRASEIRFG